MLDNPSKATDVTFAAMDDLFNGMDSEFTTPDASSKGIDDKSNPQYS